jgi:translation initiation factor IF-3
LNRKDRNDQPFYRVNHQIRLPRVRVIFNGENLGEMSTDDARALARKNNLDLVEIAPNVRPPVCKIIAFDKFRYEQSQKSKKKVPNNQQKEVQMGPVIEDHDLDVKVKLITKFLKEGHPVQIRIRYKGFQMRRKELGFDVAKKIIEKTNDCCSVRSHPKMNGKNLIFVLESLNK